MFFYSITNPCLYLQKQHLPFEIEEKDDDSKFDAL